MRIEALQRSPERDELGFRATTTARGSTRLRDLPFDGMGVGAIAMPIETHLFFGVVDLDGFATFRMSVSTGEFGADDFTFAISGPSTAALTALGLVGLAMRRRGGA